MRIFSYGGGVQSTAVLVLAAQGRLQYDHFLFANVGEDSENPDTLEYFKDIALPFAAEYGLDLIEVRRSDKQTIRERIFSDKRDVPIPVRMESGAPGNRKCTEMFKIKVVNRWFYDHRNGSNNMTVGLGISTDEIQRARSKEPEEIYKGLTRKIEYPLIDLHISRDECRKIVADAGLPTPPKSACYFCPLHHDLAWFELRQKRPDLFFDAVKIEKRLQQKREEYWGKDKAWMHRKLIPLDHAIPDQPFLFDMDEMDNCESGYCFT